MLLSIGTTCWRWLRRHILTRENAWAVLLSVVLLLLLLMMASGTQPRFIYGNF